MAKIKCFVNSVLLWFSIGIVVVMTGLVTYQVITRYVFNRPSATSEVLARYLFVWLTMFGGAYVFGKREHMNIAFLREKLPLPGKMILEILSELLIAGFAFMVMFYGGRIYALKQMGSIDPSINVSMGYIYLSLPIAGIVILFYALCNIVDLAGTYKGMRCPIQRY
jgi:TRAP-type C4-dicarboxylate transport system permease small subunit